MIRPPGQDARRTGVLPEWLCLRVLVRYVQKRGDGSHYLSRRERFRNDSAVRNAMGGPLFSVGPTHINHRKFWNQLSSPLSNFPAGRARTEIYIGNQAMNCLALTL